MENRNTFFKSIPDGKGGFITAEWTFGELVGVNIVGYLLAMAFISICLGTVAPIFCLFAYFVSTEEQRRATNVVGILCGVFYLVDYHYAFLSRLLLNIFLSEGLVNMFTYLQAGIIVAHIVLLFFDRKIYFSEANEEQRLPRLFLWVVGIIVGGYMLASAIIPHVLPPLPIEH